MDTIKIVHLTNEQYEELLTNGQVEINGEIKYYDENTTYVCPSSESWAELNNKIDEALIKPNRVLHNPYSVEELETIIARLREQYEETDSVVGFRCTMKAGQQLKLHPTYRMYLNETLREYDYTCENDNEMISIVLFSTGQNMVITEELIQFKNNIETYIEQKVNSITINSILYETAHLLTSIDFQVAHRNMHCEEVRIKNVIGSYSQGNATVLFPGARRATLAGDVGGSLFTYNTLLEEANVENVLSLSPNYIRQPFAETTNPKLMLNFVNLKYIHKGVGYGNYGSCIFQNVNHVILGEKVESIKYKLVSGVCNIVELYCKDVIYDAEDKLLGFEATIHYLYLCPEWNCELNLTRILGLQRDNIVEIFNNLKDLTGEDTKTLSFTRNLYSQLSEEELAIATNKNWTISYA